MTDSPLDRARALIAKADAVKRQTHWRIGADKVLMFEELVQGLREAIAYSESIEAEYDELLSRATYMLEAVAVKPLNGSKRWWEEMPGPHSLFVSSIKRMHELLTRR